MHSFWQRIPFGRGELLALAGLLLAVLCLYGTGHDRYGLFDVDEAIFTQATREMEANGSWAMPSYNAEPRYHKPPLIYWAQALGMQALGQNSLWAARLPSALAAMLTVLLLWFGVWRLTERPRWALWSAAILAGSLGFLVVGRAATADGLLNLVVLATTLAVVRLLYGKPWGWGKLVVGVLAGIGFLAKGPVAWLVPGLVGLAVMFGRADWQKSWRKVWKRAKPVQLLLVALVVLVPWVWLLFKQGGWGFFYEFLVVHNLQRFGAGLSNTQSDSPLYYVVVALVGMFPLVWFVPSAVYWLKDGWRSRLASRHAKDALPILGLLWGLGVIVIFSFSATKLAHYIVPAYAGLAIALGAMLDRHPRVRVPIWPRWCMLVMGMAMGGVLGYLGVALQELQGETLRGGVAYVQAWAGFEWPLRDVLAREVLAQRIEVPVAAFALMGGCIVVASFLLWRGMDRTQDWQGWLVAGFAFWYAALFLLAWSVVPTVWRYVQEPLAVLAKRLEYVPEGVPVIHLGLHKPSVLYLSQRRFLKLERALQVPMQVREGQRAVVLLEQADLPDLYAEFNIRKGTVTPQECRGGYCLVLVDRVIK